MSEKVITEKKHYSFVRTKRDCGNLPTALLSDYQIPQEIAAKFFDGEMKVSFVPVISVRKGSSLKDKNLREYRGEPLLKRAISKARAVFGGVCYVITDSEEYAEKAREWGAIVPFIDQIHKDGDMVSEAVKRFVNRTKIIDALKRRVPVVVVLMQATSPNTSEETIGNCAAWAARKFFAFGSFNHRPTLFSGYEMPNKENAVYRARLDGNAETLEQACLCGEGFRELPVDVNRQELNKLYGLTGGVFCVPLENCVPYVGAEGYDVSVFDAGAPLRFLYIAPLAESLDIDKEEDFAK